MVEKLYGVPSEELADGLVAWQERAEKAEAEVERLREAIRQHQDDLMTSFELDGLDEIGRAHV